jgi:hypothetical protein
MTNEHYPNGDAPFTPNRAVRAVMDAFIKAAGAAACALAQ